MKTLERKKLLKLAFNNISKDEVGKLKGGQTGGSGQPHSCSGWSIDCWCDAHCFWGIDCTKGWY